MGRAPTKGYCHTCRKRRVKCDKQLPACQRCIRAGYDCQGYENPLRMENYGMVKSSDGASLNLARIPAGAITAAAVEAHTPMELGFVAFEDNAYFAFMSYHSGWVNAPITQLCAAQAYDEMSYNAAKAVSMGFLAHEHRFPELRLKAGAIYQKLLKELARRLQRRQRKEMAVLVVPIMAMVGYELVSDKTAAHLSHQNGIAGILQYCGPSAYQQQPLLVTFELARVVLACHGLAAKKRSILEEHDWLTIPWKIHSKDLTQEIVDIFVEFPGLFEDITGSSLMIDHHYATKLMARLYDIRHRLYRWRHEWNVQNPKAGREVPCDDMSFPSTGTGAVISHLAKGQLGNRLLYYENFSQAMDLSFYHSMLLWVWRLENIVAPGSAPAEGDVLTTSDLDYIVGASTELHPENPLLMPGDEQLFCQPAIEVIRSIRYLITNTPTSKDHKMAVIAPVAVLYAALQPDGDLAQWLELMFSASGQFSQQSTAVVIKNLALHLSLPTIAQGISSDGAAGMVITKV
ncbi:hypothetical protein BX600DRAFT_438242 [Xylariales sp. PMI_506]|nr:hypothetical protein BX600DRAFT_438242 [Xylariales sp. PMI_506]